MKLFSKYKHLNSLVTIYECVAELDDGSFVLVYTNYYGNRYSIIVSKEKAKEYKEYIEPPKPVIHERWIAYYRNSGGIFAIMSKKEPTKDVLHKEKVIYTEYPEPIQKETKKPAEKGFL